MKSLELLVPTGMAILRFPPEWRRTVRLRIGVGVGGLLVFMCLSSFESGKNPVCVHDGQHGFGIAHAKAYDKRALSRVIDQPGCELNAQLLEEERVRYGNNSKVMIKPDKPMQVVA